MPEPGDLSEDVEGLVDSRVREMRRCIHVMESGLERELKELEQELERTEDDPGVRQLKSEFNEFYLHHHIGGILRSGLVMAAYALAERILVLICTWYVRYSPHVEAPEKGFRRADIGCAKDFLKNQVGVDVPDQSREWWKLKNLQRLRDAFAHRRGHLREDEVEGALGQYLEQHEFLVLETPPPRAKIEKGYTARILETVESFFTDLVDRLPPLKPWTT